VHTAMVQVLLTACERDQDPDPASKLSAKSVLHIPIAVCTDSARLLMMDRETVRNM